MSTSYNYQDDCQLDGVMSNKRNKVLSESLTSSEVLCQNIDDFLINFNSTSEKIEEEE